jgi:hypothetical protein
MLLEKYPMVLIPPLPEKPGSHADAVYIEKKRLQVERYLAKVFARSELVDSSDLSYFLSDRMNTLDVAKTRSVVQSIARLIPFKALLPSDYQNGFRIFSPSDFIDGADDQEEFMRRRSYILLMESNLTRLVESAVRIIKRKEQTSKLMHQLAYALKDPIVTMNNTDDTDVAVAADRRLAPSSKSFEELYQAFGDLKDISLKQVCFSLGNFNYPDRFNALIDEARNLPV